MKNIVILKQLKLNENILDNKLFRILQLFNLVSFEYKYCPTKSANLIRNNIENKLQTYFGDYH